MMVLFVAASTYGGFTNTNIVVRVGYLPEEIQQHPIDPDTFLGGWTQGYLDLVDKGHRVRQIVVLYPKGTPRPDQAGRLVEVIGITKQVDLGGEAGKNSYKNELIHVKNWQYLGTTNVPNQAAHDTAPKVADPGR